MFNRIKNIFKKTVETTHNWISFLAPYVWSPSIRDNEYVKFFIWWQYAAITAIADSVSTLNYRLSDGKDKQISHPYLEFVTPELLQNISVFMKMTGSAYVWKVMAWNKVIWLDMLLPWCISPVIDTNWNLLYWNYMWNGKSIRLETSEVMVFAEFNPYERYPYITRWYSPIQAIAMTVRGEKEIESRNYSLLTNDVPPGMVLTTDQPLTQEQVQAIKSNWEANHTWAKNAGKLAILPFGIKPNNVQASPKEMDFISQQNWDRDKILAIYKVPKAILWIWEWVNVWNVKSFNQIFSQRCIEPLTRKISRVLNDKLFDWIWFFEFLNVLPTDEDAVREHYLSWWITRNEYRQELWYNPIKWWDVFFDGSEAEKVDTEWKKFSIDFKWLWIDFSSIVKSNIPWSEDWMIKRHSNKNNRYIVYEKRLREWFLKVFSKQEKAILSEFDKNNNWKSFSSYISNKAIKLKLDKKYYAVYQLFLKDTVEEIVKKEWERASKEINAKSPFRYDENIAKEVKEMLTKLAKEVDSVTDEKLLKAIGKATNEWLSTTETKEVLEDVFKDLKTTRLDKIIRTESIRYWSYAEQKAWEESWVVKYKERWTAPDNRRCEKCKELHGKKVKLGDEFLEWISWAPLHPNCRCDMIPCIE